MIGAKNLAGLYMTTLKKGQPREEDCYLWGGGLPPHPHMYPSHLLEGSSFSEPIHETSSETDSRQAVESG
jgi:hypothetical protein